MENRTVTFPYLICELSIDLNRPGSHNFFSCLLNRHYYILKLFVTGLSLSCKTLHTYFSCQRIELFLCLAEISIFSINDITTFYTKDYFDDVKD